MEAKSSPISTVGALWVIQPSDSTTFTALPEVQQMSEVAFTARHLAGLLDQFLLVDLPAEIRRV